MHDRLKQMLMILRPLFEMFIMIFCRRMNMKQEWVPGSRSNGQHLKLPTTTASPLSQMCGHLESS